MSHEPTPLTPALYSYIRSISVRDDDVLARLRDETARHPRHAMQVSADEGQLLHVLTRLAGGRRALEVGTFTGYSALCIARALVPGGRLTCCDVSEEFTSIARRYWAEAGVADRIDLKLAPAVVTLDALLADGQAGTFDFAFIDADKVNYAAYVERALRLVRKGGLIAIDNVLWDGRVIAESSTHDADTRAIVALNAALHADPRVDVAVLPVADGVTLCVVR